MTRDTVVGDCLHVLDDIAPESVDLAYVDPPFYTQKVQQLVSRDGEKNFSFSDVWKVIDPTQTSYRNDW